MDTKTIKLATCAIAATIPFSDWTYMPDKEADIEPDAPKLPYNPPIAPNERNIPDAKLAKRRAKAKLAKKAKLQRNRRK